MDRAGHRVLGNAGAGREIARHEIIRAAPGGDRQAHRKQARDPGVVGDEAADSRLVLELDENILEISELRLGRPVEDPVERVRQSRQRLRVEARQVETVAVLAARHAQGSRPCRKGQRSARPVLAEKHMRRSQGGMPAKVDLVHRREPAQLPVPRRLAGAGEGRFSQIVFFRDRLHERVGQPALQDQHRCRVAGEHVTGEGVDLIHQHRLCPPCRSRAMPCPEPVL